MYQLIIGKFILQKRKEKNWTQEQLGEKIGVSNKTISKWETGKCMPDYSIIKNLCQELEISIAELMNGEATEENSVYTYDNEHVMDLLKRTQELEKQKNILYGIILLVMGMISLSVANTIGGSSAKDFVSGLLLGLSFVEMIVGLYNVGRFFRRQVEAKEQR